MTIPTFQELMLPILKILNNNQINQMKEIVDELAMQFNLSEDELEELIPSGNKRFSNRVGWAVTHLKKASLLESIGKSKYSITGKGKNVLAENPVSIDMKFLSKFAEYEAFRHSSKRKIKRKTQKEIIVDSPQTPEELMDSSYQSIKDKLAIELLELIKENSPKFFETLVVDLLVAIGYGSNITGSGKTTGQPYDGGIDGLIKQDKLGLDNIYIQAKRWVSTVGRPTVQEFAGSLLGKGASKGVLITPSGFSKEAIDYVDQFKHATIILIDGVQLAELMIDYNIGVSETNRYIIKKIDRDYFEI